MLTKTCSKCKETLPIEMFYPDSTKRSGYKSRCKLCISEDNKERKLRDSRVKKDKYKSKHFGYKKRTEKKYPYPVKKKYYLTEGNYYIYKEFYDSTRDDEIIIKILSVDNRPQKNTCNITFKQIEPPKEEIIVWSFPLSSLRYKWKYELLSKDEVLRRVGKKNID